MKPVARASLCAISLCAMLGACAAAGTRVTSDGEFYKVMAQGQQVWCSNVGGCDCTMDGKKVTCGLVQTCLGSGKCTTVP